MNDQVCIMTLHTSKVCNLFFGGIFPYAYLLKGVHFGTWARGLSTSYKCRLIRCAASGSESSGFRAS